MAEGKIPPPFVLHVLFVALAAIFLFTVFAAVNFLSSSARTNT